MKQLKPEETPVLCKRNEPVAEERPVARNAVNRRIGWAKGEFTVPPSFFEPLPPEILKGFNGGGELS